MKFTIHLCSVNSCVVLARVVLVAMKTLTKGSIAGPTCINVKLELLGSVDRLIDYRSHNRHFVTFKVDWTSFSINILLRSFVH